MALTHARKTDKGTEPFPTRAQIDQGALKDRNLELLYLADPVEVFFLQVQGSGRVKLTDGSIIRIHYDGKNGHPYTSIGRYLIDKGLLAADKVSMGALKRWLKADPERAKHVLWQNASYVFFRELKGTEAGRPAGRYGRPAHARPQPGRRHQPPCAGPADLRQRRGHDARRQGRHLQPAHDRAGRRLRHQGPRARRHLLRLGRCSRAAGGRDQARRPVHRAAAEGYAGAGRGGTGQAGARTKPGNERGGPKVRQGRPHRHHRRGRALASTQRAASSR